ncbi:MAG: short-chain dehydrogenase [Deltaproteobacteria bacterium RBG_19FT_COMBO_43_11]|nr:MAG: short-chain dehydrogenase [Deltaproteobacteria bacterium RBG_19FT_COMBO_43_11]
MPRRYILELNKKIRIYDGATAIVTGGASGIGKALSQELARRGCEVVLADLQIETAEDVATEIRDSGGKAQAVNLDVTDFPAMERVVRETFESRGRLDYIFNNAGIAIGGTATHYTIDDWNKIIDVNLRGVVNGIQAAYFIMIEQGFGHIVNTASMAGLMPNPLGVAYAATKHAIVGLSRSLRTEAAQMGIRVSVICPGVIRTPILEGGKYGKINMNISTEKLREMWEEFRPMAPDMFAKKVLNAVAKNRAIIIVPFLWKSIWWLNRLSPALGMAFAQNRLKKIQKNLVCYNNY